MTPETPKENPVTQALEAARKALAGEASTTTFAREALDSLSRAVGPEAITKALDSLQALPAYKSLSDATRQSLDMLHAAVGSPANIAQALIGQAGSAVIKGLETLPWYVKYPLIYGGIRFVESRMRKTWEWVKDKTSSVKKIVLVGGAGLLAGMGIKSMHDASAQHKQGQ